MIGLAADHSEMCKLDEDALALRKVIQVCQKLGSHDEGQDPARSK